MKATKAKTRARVEDFLHIRLDGAEAWDIRQYVSDKASAGEEPWKLAEGEKLLSERQLRRYVAQADKLIDESYRSTRKRSIRRHLAQRRNLYARAVNMGDIRTALAIKRDEAELLGLYPAKKTELTGKGGAPIYPPLEAMVAALVNAERDGGQKDDTGSSSGDGASAARGEALP